MSAEYDAIFNVVGSYFVDILFNHVYLSAKSTGDDLQTIKENYRKLMINYTGTVKSDEASLRDTSARLHVYFKNTTVYSTISYAELVNIVVKPFVPEDYFERLSYKNRDIIFNRVIQELLSQLSSAILKPEMMSRIVDHRMSQHTTTIATLQQYAVAVMKSIAAEYTSTFLRRKVTKDEFPFSSLDDIKLTLQQALIDKAEFKAKCSKLEKALEVTSRQLDADREYYQYREAQFINLVTKMGLELKTFQVKDIRADTARAASETLKDELEATDASDDDDAESETEERDPTDLSSEIAREFEQFDRPTNVRVGTVKYADLAGAEDAEDAEDVDEDADEDAEDVAAEAAEDVEEDAEDDAEDDAADDAEEDAEGGDAEGDYEEDAEDEYEKRGNGLSNFIQ